MALIDFKWHKRISVRINYILTLLACYWLAHACVTGCLFIADFLFTLAGGYGTVVGAVGYLFAAQVAVARSVNMGWVKWADLWLAYTARTLFRHGPSLAREKMAAISLNFPHNLIPPSSIRF